MGNIFNYDGPVIRIGNLIASLLWLNILTILCCIPIITAGASLTAMHYVLLKISNDEDSKVSQCFFRALKENMKKSTQIWLVYLVLSFVLIFDFLAIYQKAISIPLVFQVILVCIAIVLVLVMTWTFILQSRYENSNVRTVKNALLLTMLHPICSLVNLSSMLLPILLVIFLPRILPVTVAFWFTLPGFLQVQSYRKVFDKLEEEKA